MFAVLLATTATAVAQTAPMGGWLDQITFFVEGDNAKALDMLKKGEMDAYFFTVNDPDLFSEVKASDKLWYALSYGSYNEIAFNPVGPEFPNTGKLNPFASAKVREAMNWLIDRDHVANEIAKGLAVPRYLAITPSFPDYARLIDTAKKLEIKYAYNFEKAKSVISAEMQKMGASIQNGKWQYKGEPVVIKALIRSEDERKDLGDYVSTQLEAINFTVERMYKVSREASPIWYSGNPNDGLFHFYTGGWVTTVVSRDQSGNFAYFYTKRGLPSPLWQAYTPSSEFDYVAELLDSGAYTTMEERNELMARALELSLEDSVRIWTHNRVSPWVARNEVKLAADLAGGFYASRMWPYTMRLVDKAGGNVRIASSDLLVEPWNPIGGTNWVYDSMIGRATADWPYIADPFTGLFWPQRAGNAEVIVQRGLPVAKTLDWVTLRFAEEIEVPEDAWIGWDAEKQEVKLAGPGVKAKSKITINWDPNLWNVKWHDGSKMSLADFVFDFIYTLDYAYEASPVYDPARVSFVKTFLSYFKGWKIVQQDPLITEHYTDQVVPDAEEMAFNAAMDWYPFAGTATMSSPWHMVTIGWLAESKKQLAFSSSKAKTLNVEWTNYIAGPSLAILSQNLNEALASRFVPYQKVLGAYLTSDQAAARYQALKSWYDARGHLYVGNGWYYLHAVDTTARIVTIRANRDSIDRADKFAGFSEPKMPDVTVTGPATIVQALAGNFTVDVSYKGQPYALSDMDFVKYLLVGPGGEVSAIGEAEPIDDGKYKVTLTSTETSVLSAGSYKLQAVAASKLVSIPVIGEASFIAVNFEDYLAGETGKMTAELKTTTDRLAGVTSDLEAKVNSLKGTANMAMIVAVIAVVLAIVAILVPKVSKKTPPT